MSEPDNDSDDNESDTPENPRDGGGDFMPSSHWSWVEDARGGGMDSEAARERLCKIYWHPLFGHARRRGLSEEDAKDAVQGFFLAFLRREGFEKADSEKGRLRAYLLGCFKNSLMEFFRGQKREPINLGKGSAELAVYDEDPELAYHLACARDLLNRALLRLRGEVQAREWEVLGPLVEAGPRNRHGEGIAAAEALGLPEGTVRSKSATTGKAGGLKM